MTLNKAIGMKFLGLEVCSSLGMRVKKVALRGSRTSDVLLDSSTSFHILIFMKDKK